MLDDHNDRAVMGGNNPPAFDPEMLADWQSKVDAFLKATQVWLKMEKIETEEHAGQLTDQIDGLRGLWRKVDDQRKAEKKPHDDAGTEVQEAYRPLLTKLDTAAKKLKPKLADYATVKAEKERKEREAAAAEAARQAEEARKAQEAAEASGDIGAQVDAEEQAKAAEKAQKEAAKPVSTGVKSATGAGRTMALRTVKEVTIDNPMQLFMALRNDPGVLEALHSAATRIVRAKGYDQQTPLPGITVTERKAVA